MVEVASHLWPTDSKAQGLALLKELALVSRAVYCVDPATEASWFESECAIRSHAHSVFGTVHAINDIAKATRRPKACCGNLWFHDIGDSVATATNGGAENESENENEPERGLLPRAIVSGASSNHFDVLVGFLDSVKQFNPTDIPVFIYDLGFTTAEHKEIRERYP